MKIAMIGHKYVPSREGGIEIVVDEISTELAKMGHNVTIFNRKRKQNKKINEYNGCKIVEIFTINKKSLDAIMYAFFATLKAKRMAERGELDIIHFHAEGPCFFLNLFPPKIKRKYKIIVTIHGLDWKRGKWGGFASKIIKSGEKKAVKYADTITVVSKNIQKYFIDEYNKETVYIPNGIRKLKIKEPEIIKKKYGLTKNSYILFLARIVPEKGLHYLIKAWKKIKQEKSTDLKLVIAGGNSHSDKYYNKIQQMCIGDDSIIQTGFVQGQILEELYSNAYLYVLPSDVEGMPISLLEAISYGIPCLVSNIEENMEIIKDEMFFFNKGDVKSLAEKMLMLINTNDIFCKNSSLLSWYDITKLYYLIYTKGNSL